MAKISSRKTQKIAKLSAKIHSSNNFVPHGTCKLFHNMKIDVICHCVRKNCTFILTKDETVDSIKTCQS